MKPLFVIVSIFSTFCLHAQGTAFFTMSATGRLSSGATVHSLPLQVNDSNMCLKLDNGIAVYRGKRGERSFVMSCRSNESQTVFQFRLFPNPTMTMSTLISTVLIRNEQNLTLSLYDTRGRLMRQLTKTADQLLAGINIDVQDFSAGNYFLRIDGRFIHEVISFLKMN